MSLLIEDIGLIFDLAAAFSVNALTFLFPAFFYLYSASKFSKVDQKMKLSSVLMLLLGVIVFALQIYTILNKNKKEAADKIIKTEWKQRSF